MQNPTEDHFDIIIAGAGLAGLTLALELAASPVFSEKKILLLDRDPKKSNDRTWCFWARPDEKINAPVFKTWANFQFHGENFDKKLDTPPYLYNMVRGIDFYGFAKKQLAGKPNVFWKNTEITSIENGTGEVRTAAGSFFGAQIFSSIFDAGKILDKEKHTWLLQHFKGWIIKTPQPVFDPETVTFMDFRIEQHGETRFVYVLPLSKTEALVEFTVFSPALLDVAGYVSGLKNYLHNFLKINDFEVLEEEFGVIPMTDFPFKPQQEGRVIYIGTAGGFVKGSSGYAFKRTQRKIRDLVGLWEKTGQPNPSAMRSPWRFRFYDRIFLRVFQDGEVPPRRVFTQLFKGRSAREIFRFLDEDTTFAQEPATLLSAPFWPFLRAFFKISFIGQVLHLFKNRK